MFVIKTENRRWWDYEIELAPRFIEVLRGIGIWLGRIGALLGGLVLPGLFITVLVDLQPSSEPDLAGGFEGLEGCLALVIGAPAGFIGLALGVASLPPHYVAGSCSWSQCSRSSSAYWRLPT